MTNPIVSAGVEAGINAVSQWWANEQNKDLYEQKRKDYVKDRDYENKYNSPVEQVKRLKAAGLNPYAFLTGANDSAGVTPLSPPNIVAPQSDIDLQDKEYTEKLIEHDIQKMENENMLTQEQAKKLRAETKGVNLENARKARELKYFKGGGEKETIPERIYRKGKDFLNENDIRFKSTPNILNEKSTRLRREEKLKLSKPVSG